MSESGDRVFRPGGELDGIDACEEIARQVKCRLETKMEAHPKQVVTVSVEINEVDRRER